MKNYLLLVSLLSTGIGIARADTFDCPYAYGGIVTIQKDQAIFSEWGGLRQTVGPFKASKQDGRWEIDYLDGRGNVWKVSFKHLETNRYEYLIDGRTFGSNPLICYKKD